MVLVVPLVLVVLVAAVVLVEEDPLVAVAVAVDVDALALPLAPVCLVDLDRDELVLVVGAERLPPLRLRVDSLVAVPFLVAALASSSIEIFNRLRVRARPEAGKRKAKASAKE